VEGEPDGDGGNGGDAGNITVVLTNQGGKPYVFDGHAIGGAGGRGGTGSPPGRGGEPGRPGRNGTVSIRVLG